MRFGCPSVWPTNLLWEEKVKGRIERIFFVVNSCWEGYSGYCKKSYQLRRNAFFYRLHPRPEKEKKRETFPGVEGNFHFQENVWAGGSRLRAHPCTLDAAGEEPLLMRGKWLGGYCVLIPNQSERGLKMPAFVAHPSKRASNRTFFFHL